MYYVHMNQNKKRVVCDFLWSLFEVVISAILFVFVNYYLISLKEEWNKTALFCMTWPCDELPKGIEVYLEGFHSTYLENIFIFSYIIMFYVFIVYYLLFYTGLRCSFPVLYIFCFVFVFFGACFSGNSCLL